MTVDMWVEGEEPEPEEREYRVRWEIDVTATSPEAAAREAQLAMRRPGTTANVFKVRPNLPLLSDFVTVDLDETPFGAPGNGVKGMETFTHTIDARNEIGRNIGRH